MATVSSTTSPISVWILGDQLLASHPALAYAESRWVPDQIRVVLVESSRRTTRLPYQRKKLILLFSAMRHYADALRAKGYVVDYVQASSVAAGLRQHVATHRSTHLVTMAAAEYRGRLFQIERLDSIIGADVSLTCLPNRQFLVEEHDPFSQLPLGKQTVMENFYRDMRRHFDVLMEPAGMPTGERWNFDHENRKPYPKRGLTTPLPLTFAPDAITRSVMAQVAQSNGMGTVDGFNLAVTHAEAEAVFDDFLTHRLPDFGPYEDAMSAENATLFHSTLSPYMNIGLLQPLDMVRKAEAAYHSGHAPIHSVEGFVRQVLGWREYVYWHYWAQMPDLLTANAWGHTRSMPRFFWDGDTEMACLRCVTNRVIETGYSHHIERLMIICNFCMLAGIDPAAVNEWFLSAYIDAYEWVVAPNVIGMGLNADGGKTATKPYIASANYINKMSNFCQGCRYNPKARTGEDACPFNFLYWNFLLEHEKMLRTNPRSGKAVLGLRHLDEAERVKVRQQASEFLAELELYCAGYT